MSTKNNQHYYPEVVVAGMPSCGKTVFLTVLAKKFTSQPIGHENTPLGFRMETVDMDTQDVVNTAYQCLEGGDWPSATPEGQIMPLKWEVFTGQRHVFDLASMDLAGETFRKAFGIRGEEGTGSGKAGRRSTRAAVKRRAGSSAELIPVDHGTEDESAEGEGDGGVTQEFDESVQKLIEAVKAAKVFCFMVDINLPDMPGGRPLTEKEKTLFDRFKNAVETMYFVLKDNAELRAKSIIVLSQSYRYQGSIDRAGGPALYLGQICGQFGIGLSNLAIANNIPVLAVSAINETVGKGNGLPQIQKPDDIPSTGLFGFLLVVAGSVAKEDALSKIKDAYLKFQRVQAEYLQSPSLLVEERFAQAQICREAAQAFVAACNSYLDDQANFMAVDSAFPLGKGSLGNFRRFTKQAPEVQCALDDVYFVRDELWDRALRWAAVVSERRTVDCVCAFVRDGLANAFPSRMGNETNDEFLYGFGEQELAYGSNAKSLTQWVATNIREYREGFEEIVKEIDCWCQWFTEVVRRLRGSVRDVHFDDELKRAKESYGVLKQKISEFQSYWLDNGTIPFSEEDGLREDGLGGLLRDLTLAAEHIRAAELEHKQHRQEEQYRLAQERKTEQQRQLADRQRQLADRQRQSVGQRRRWLLCCLLGVLVTIIVILLIARR